MCHQVCNQWGIFGQTAKQERWAICPNLRRFLSRPGRGQIYFGADDKVQTAMYGFRMNIRRTRTNWSKSFIPLSFRLSFTNTSKSVFKGFYQAKHAFRWNTKNIANQGYSVKHGFQENDTHLLVFFIGDFCHTPVFLIDCQRIREKIRFLEFPHVGTA